MLAWQAWAAADLPEGVEPLSVQEAGGELWEPGKPVEPENLSFQGNIDYGPPDVELPVPAEQGLGGERARALTDIWEDEHSLRFLRGDGLDPAWPEKEQERVPRRCRAYRFADGVLIRTMTDGQDKVVPAPAQRPNLVKEVHNFTGHLGEKRTVHLLKKTHWWAGMYDAAQKGVAECQQCDRAKASFAVMMTGMQSLPIMALGYRWILDFAGPLVTTRSKKRFVLRALQQVVRGVGTAQQAVNEGGGGVPGGDDAVRAVCRAADGQRARVRW
jgi:hypothetical protein